MSRDLKRKIDNTDSQNDCDNKRRFKSEQNIETKISNIVNAVLTQDPLGKLVIIQHEDTENPYVTLQNSVSYCNMNVEVFRTEHNKNDFELKIDGVEFVKGDFQNIQVAKKALGEEALQKLKEICFFINKKKDFCNVSKSNLQEGTSEQLKSSKMSVSTDSIAHKIMMKMGWAGGGLGIQEQGNIDSVMLYENVNRQGLGSGNLMREIYKKLESFSKSSNLLTLVFDANFTKEERASIHKAARKFNLKSKSTGNEQNRKLAISKKITRMDIVKELLFLGGEDGLYKLHIPTKFAHMWYSLPQDK